MYSWEITNLVERYNHNLPSWAYLDMTENSPQIGRVTYNAWNDKIEMWDEEGNYWIFKVYYDAA